MPNCHPSKLKVIRWMQLKVLVSKMPVKQYSAMPVKNGTLTNKDHWSESSLSREQVLLKCYQSVFKVNTIVPISGLSNEILCILVL